MPPIIPIPNGPELDGSPDTAKKPGKTLGSYMMYFLTAVVLGMGAFFTTQKDRYQKGYQNGVEDARKTCNEEKALLNIQLTNALHENDSLRNENAALLRDKYETILNHLDIQRGKATITIKQKKP